MKKLEGAGLRGQSAGQTSLSTVEQEGSLRYLGYSIEDLAENASFEEVAYLLLLGKLPTSSELAEFEDELMNQRTMPDSLVSVVESIPASETRIFIEKVMSNYWIYRLRFGQPTPSLTQVSSGYWPLYQSFD